jgi:ubiquinone/menaquinone biosynthesis C-methylase UbiE
MKVFSKIKGTLLTYENNLKVKGITGLKLDVGCGSLPFPYANVICDLFDKDDFQREGHKLRTMGKPFIRCDVQFLPFRTGFFGFVNCSHVLEHVPNPQLALEELTRTGRIVFLETPTWLREDVFCSNPYHKWVFVVKEGKLLIRSPRNGKNLRLDRFPFFNSFEYIVNKMYPFFILKLKISNSKERQMCIEKTR